MAGVPEVAPILSTPDNHILEATEPTTTPRTTDSQSDEELNVIYDIERTIKEIRQGRWRRIALQFPDEMLPDAPRVFQLLSRGLESSAVAPQLEDTQKAGDSSKSCACGKLADNGTNKLDLEDVTGSFATTLSVQDVPKDLPPRLYILGDTSYGTCCVDEVAAEHVDADAVVHYGRACLSPTSRLPVVYVFTHRKLDFGPLVEAFEDVYPNKDEKILVVADVTYANHVEAIASMLMKEKGYTNLFATSVVHDPASPVPNRTIPASVREEPESLRNWQLFHISDPPTSLLLTLSSRVASIRIYSTNRGSSTVRPPKTLLASTAAALRRRYAILTSLNTAPIFGILINTLSVKNYLHIVQHVQQLIAGAGKKSYLFVVGKLNAAKVANFSEIGGWVVIGCWESSLVDSADFWKPVITPYELELALQKDTDRVWTGEWRGDYQAMLDDAKLGTDDRSTGSDDRTDVESRSPDDDDDDDDLSESESAPPEFDLRTGRYVSAASARPMRSSHVQPASSGMRRSIEARNSTALTRRMIGEIATISGVVSPGAEFLRSNRTWNGLGSDFTVQYEDDGEAGRGSVVVEGRSGVARGYTVGVDTARR